MNAGIHAAFLAIVFGWVALPLAAVHLVIDCRWPVEKWSRFVRQTQPRGAVAVEAYAADPEMRPYSMNFDTVDLKIRSGAPSVEERLDALMADMREWTTPVFDIGASVRMWNDQVFHIACVAVAALLVAM